MASSIFAKIGNIKGESTDARHKDEIVVLSWTWGVTQSGTMSFGGGGGSGKASFQDLNFTHHIDKATPLLLKACATGQHIPDATITVRKAGKGQLEYLIIKLTDVVVTSVSMSDGSGDTFVPMESVGLAFAKVEYGYKPQNPNGSLGTAVEFKFDLATGRVF
jgi:type VI secretion system secreted protein Hcp